MRTCIVLEMLPLFPMSLPEERINIGPLSLVFALSSFCSPPYCLQFDRKITSITPENFKGTRVSDT